MKGARSTIGFENAAAAPGVSWFTARQTRKSPGQVAPGLKLRPVKRPCALDKSYFFIFFFFFDFLYMPPPGFSFRNMPPPGFSLRWAT